MKKSKISFVMLAGLLGMLVSCGPTSEPTQTPEPSDEPTSQPDVSNPDPTEPSTPPAPVFVAPEAISLIGTIGEGADWNTDYDLTTTDDGHNWVIEDFVMMEGEEWKIRMNHNWGDVGRDNWGYGYLDEASKALFTGSDNIVVGESAYYTVSFFYDEGSSVISVVKGDHYYVAADPTIVVDGAKEYTVAAGEAFTLPTITALDYKENDISEYIEAEDLFENGTIKDGVFTAKTAGDHTIALYVEDEDGRYAEEEIMIHVTPAHPETYDVTGCNDLAVMADYGVFKENFEKGKKSPFAAYNDSNNASYLTATDEAIAGNSIVIDFNKTAGSAANQLFMSAFNDYYKRGIQATYKVSFDYKIIAQNGNTGDIYFGLSWDNSNGLNNTFVKSGAVTGEVYRFETSFPGTVVPESGNAWFSFFKLSGSTSDVIIAVDSFKVETVELAQVVPYTPSSDEVMAGFTWDFDTYGQTSTNGETVIIDNLDNADAKAAMKADSNFSRYALKLINADGHIFGGLTKNNMIAGMILNIEVYYYAVNGNGMHLIMMGESGVNPTIADGSHITSLGNGMYKIAVSSKVGADWASLNIYGAGNPSFEIYLGYVKVSLTEPEPIPENTTPNGYSYGYTIKQETRAFGVENKGSHALSDFDNNPDAIANPNMGTAPQKWTINGGNLTMEWFRGDNKVEVGYTYEITLVTYVEKWNATGDSRLMVNIDNACFINLSDCPTVGYHEYKVTWVAEKTADFISFYVPGTIDGAIYIGYLQFKLVEGNGITAPKSDNGHSVGTTWSQNTRQFGCENKGSHALSDFDNNADAIANPNMGSAPQKWTINGGNLTMEWFQGNGRIEVGCTYEFKIVCYVEKWTAATDDARLMINIDNACFVNLTYGPTVGYQEYTVTWTAEKTADFVSFYIPGTIDGAIYVGSFQWTLVGLAK